MTHSSTSWQNVLPIEAVVYPAAQVWHPALLPVAGLYVPMAQGTQPAPTDGVPLNPGTHWQSEIDVDPTAAVDVRVGQLSHCVDAAWLEYKPNPHAWQTMLLPADALNEPAAQGRMSPAAEASS